MFGQLVFCALLIALGLQLFFKPSWYAFLIDTYLNYSDHNRFWGSVCMLAGVTFLALVIRRRMKNKKKGDHEVGGGYKGASKRDDRV
jgi:hypothetical protein